MQQIGDVVREGGAQIDRAGEQLRAPGSVEEQERRPSVLDDPTDGG